MARAALSWGCVLMIAAAPLGARAEAPIHPDRPREGPSPQTIGPWAFALEVGVNAFHSPTSDDLAMIRLPLKLRWGTWRWLELAVITQGVSININEIANVYGISDVHVGGKAQLTHADGWRPALAIASDVRLPVYSSFSRSPYAVSLSGAAQWSLPHHLFYRANLGTSVAPDDVVPRSLQWATSIAYDPLTRWSVGGFVELYGSYIADRDTTPISALAGLTYRSLRAFQLDVFLRYGVWDTQRVGGGAGISTRY